MFRRLLVAYDGSAGAKRALETAVDLARRDDATLFGLVIASHLPRYGATVGEVEEERLYGEQEGARLLEDGVGLRRPARRPAGDREPARPSRAGDRPGGPGAPGRPDRARAQRAFGGVGPVSRHHRREGQRHADCSVLIVR